MKLHQNMKYLFVLFLAGIGFSSFCQDGLVQKTKLSSIGYNYLSSDSIKGLIRSFNSEIYNLQIDSHATNGTFQLLERDKKGRLSLKSIAVRYDFELEKVLWNRKVTLQYHSIEQKGKYTIYDNGRKSYSLDNQNGEELWDLKNKFILIDAKEDIGISYLYNPLPNAKEKIEGIDLEDGSKIWERELNKDYNVNEILYLDDHKVLIASSGIHSVDLRNGEGWSYHGITGEKDFKKATIGTGVGVAVGLLSGFYFGVTGHDLLWQLNSNVLVDSLHIYFASKDKLAKLDMQGAVLWECDLDEENSSNSYIFKSSDKLILINRGLALLNNREISYGKPFITAYDLEGGNQVYLNEVVNNETAYFSSIRHDENYLYATIEDRLERYSLKSGEKLKTQTLDEKQFGSIARLIDLNFYIEQDSSFKNSSDLENNNLFLLTDSAKIVMLNQEMEFENQIEKEALYYPEAEFKGYTLISNGKHTYLIDQKGDRIAKIIPSTDYLIRNNKLFLVDKNHLIEIELENLL